MDAKKQVFATMRRVLDIEASALLTLATSLDETMNSAVERCLATEGRIICAGVGKSGHVARKIAATLSSTGSPAQFVHPTEASHGDMGMITRADTVLTLSLSGETPELSDMIAYTKRFNIALLGMTANADSALGKASDYLLLLPEVPEACSITSAPTTSTTMMMALGDALAVALLERKGFKSTDFHDLHPGGKLGSMLKRVSELMHVGDAIPLVPTGTAFDQAIEVLSKKRLGCVGIVENDDRLIGILTDGDIRRIVTRQLTFETINEAMIESPITVTPDSLAQSALALMSERNITQLFVVDGGRCVGLLHVHELLKNGVI